MLSGNRSLDLLDKPMTMPSCYRFLLSFGIALDFVAQLKYCYAKEYFEGLMTASTGMRARGKRLRECRSRDQSFSACCRFLNDVSFIKLISFGQVNTTWPNTYWLVG